MGGCCSKAAGGNSGVVPGSDGAVMQAVDGSLTPRYEFDGSRLRVAGVTAIPPSIVEKYSQTTSFVDLSSCGLLDVSSLEHLQDFPRLTGLALADNALDTLVAFPNLLRLTDLDLSRNALGDVHEMVTLLSSKTPALKTLDSRMNPCCPHPRYQVDKTDADYNIYRNYVLTRLHSLELLDEQEVTEAEREAARAIGRLMGKGTELTPLATGSAGEPDAHGGSLLHAATDTSLAMRDPETGALLTHEQALILKRRSLHKIRREVTAAAAGNAAPGSSGGDVSDESRRMVRSLSTTTSSDFVETMLSSMDIVHYQEGDLIVRRGDVGSAMFFIIAGTVEIILPDRAEGEQRPNPTCASGDFFGEIAMFLERKRTASVRAATDVDVCVLTKDMCEAVLFQYPLIHHEFLMLAQNRLQADLDGQGSAAHATPAWMKSVAHAVENMASPSSSPSGASRPRAGPNAGSVRSHAEAGSATASGDALVAASVSTADIHEQRRKLRMGALHRQFEEWDVEQNKNTTHRRKMKAHKRKWFSINVARGIDQYDIPKFLKEVLGSMITQHYEGGDYIVRRGERGSSMFFIARGVVDIEFDAPADGSAKRENVTLGAGDFFGEIAMFIEGKRTASVVARTEVDLSVLTKKVMDSVLSKYPMIKEEFVLLGQERLRKDQQWASIVGGEPKKPHNWMEKISRRAGTLFLKAKSGTADDADGMPEGALSLAAISPSGSQLATALKSKRDEVISLMRQCYVLFDFEDPQADPQGKAHKQRALLTLAEVYGTGTDVAIDEMEYPVLLSLLRANLLFERPRPPGLVTELHAADFDFTDEPEPALLKSWPHVEVVYHIFKSFLKHPSFSVTLAKEYITRDFVAELLDLLNSYDADERNAVKDVLVVVYSTCTYLQRFLRDSIAHVILTFVYENELHAGPGELIKLVHEAGMLAHFGNPPAPDGVHYISSVVFALFKSAQLIRFIDPLLDLVNDAVLPLAVLARTSAAKEELFLRQVGAVFDTLGPAGALALPEPTRAAALERVALCIESPQLQVAERALNMLGTEAFEAVVNANLRSALPALIGPLYRNSRSHWDRYINSLTYDRLQAIMELDKMAFATALQDYAKTEIALGGDVCSGIGHLCILAAQCWRPLAATLLATTIGVGVGVGVIITIGIRIFFIHNIGIVAKVDAVAARGRIL
ncbi:serine/threonine protein phosphatase 2A [Thecamonas trahens ATCC 50062]|uniref:Serine/threonine protein phosphatase 2A n=1 Tax=Thecamonas trahens ATCC 50062 TaxID=461836 RepID=A0A0L0D945_THETB|nr:serine/threonine protein phosphatase 2A [Thecamonas trahens ATCC 50062]KNC48760.1 serine/threonine protein phosphatase 2A [Thecamonas trahens ATCC 50062]|eukprot:XP_013762811.1 serine/threonine protein phosphatase 2A [Thecamonas trahens ATCC 50062]